ncbi:AT-rich interactive domain-containing protein 1-like [Benincasa hispida]|uniref:AT-rich interactive domain-containing protein 1-like n=1 Tax=Benincasa hispida TaxID=102211 RepID=UPI0019006237|nr:AT-rich interactive domain-containing protein 1-like [Benincasa hispida]XP_038878812.1 AT-rich interactive domain-containing protein 1-like [Benincasa hispida]
MVSNEQTFDLFKLFVAVRDKGGYDVVSRKDLWDLVAEESGLGSIISSTLKVLYVEYLNVLERLLERVVEDRDSTNSCSSNGDGTGFGFNGMSPDTQFLKKNRDLHESNFLDYDDMIVVLKIDRHKNIAGCEETLCQLNTSQWDIYDTNDLYEDEDSSLELASNVAENFDDSEKSHSRNVQKDERAFVDGVESNVEFSHDSRKCDGSDSKEGVITDSISVEEINICHEKKCESMSGMVNWITEIAKNPCNPVIGLLPKSSKWKSSGNEEIWKQVLLTREAMLLNGHINSYFERSAQQGIHPSMFDDHQGSSYNLRQRTKSSKIFPCGMSRGQSRLPSMKDQLDQEILVATDSWMPDYMGKSASKQILIGPEFQVEVPEWSGITSESDSKWLGTLVWPLDKENKAFRRKHDPIGKGRDDLCKCQVRGSIECIQYHILKKRYKVKREIGSAFYNWKFDKMGEEVRLRWTEKDEQKFKGAVRSSSASFKQSFRTRIYKYFPYKSREDILCYYFNVFLLHHRGFQNRFTPDNICSDDELEYLCRRRKPYW